MSGESDRNTFGLRHKATFLKSVDRFDLLLLDTTSGKFVWLEYEVFKDQCAVFVLVRFEEMTDWYVKVVFFNLGWSATC